MKKVFAPFRVLKYEWTYILWAIFLLFGLLDIWFGIFKWDLELIIQSINSGILATFSISICVPFIMEFLLSWILQRKIPVQFIKYRAVSAILDFVWIMVTIGLWLGAGKNHIFIQITICLISIVFAFYMYCIEKMSNHYGELKIFDEEYLDTQKKNMSELKNKASETTTIGEVEL